MFLKETVYSTGQRGIGGRINETISVIQVRDDGGLGSRGGWDRGSDSGYILKVEVVDLPSDWM